MPKKRIYNDLKSAKHWLRSQPALKLDDNFKIEDKNPSDFIRNFILNYNLRYKTVYVKNGYQQTSKARYRSAGDIFRIAYHYFPRVKLITVYNVLFDLISDKKVESMICSTVRKRVYYRDGYGDFFAAPTDELGIDFNTIDSFRMVNYDGSDDTSYLIQHKIPKID